MDLNWKNNSLQQIQLLAGHNTQKELLYRDQQITVNLKAGVPFTYRF